MAEALVWRGIVRNIGLTGIPYGYRGSGGVQGEALKTGVSYRSAYRTHLFERVYEGLGGVCACCGETERKFLTIDHVRKNGKEHRKRIGTDQIALCLDILRVGCDRSEYQLLCANCHLAKDLRGGCPHQDGRRRVRAIRRALTFTYVGKNHEFRGCLKIAPKNA